MPRENIRMPSSSAGVMSFYDEERSSVRLKPMHVVIMCVLVALVVILLELGVFG
jgi:preprotein translocase subunit Sec61beta